MNNQNKISEILSYWLDKITQEDRSTIEKLWNEAGQADEAEKLTLSEEEKEHSLAHIKSELGLDSKERQLDAPVRPIRSSVNWRWIAAAATLLVAAGVSYLFIPVQEMAPYGEQKVVQLPDNTKVTLNSGSTLSYNRLFGYTHRNSELNGEAFFEVETGERPFIVETYNASVTVLGTKFNLRSWASEPESETMVTLTEGRLSFHPLDQSENAVLLNPGQQSAFGNNMDAPTNPDEASITNAVSWMENRFAFENRPLRQIINELERRFNITVQVEPAHILSDSLTIYYSSEVQAEDVINDICLSKGVSYRPINDGYVIEN